MTQVPYPASAGAPDVRGLAEGAHMPRPCKNDAPACRGAGTSTREGKMRLARSRPAQEDHPDGAGTGQVSHAGGALLVTCRPGLTRNKLRRLELKAGAPKEKVEPGIWSTISPCAEQNRNSPA